MPTIFPPWPHILFGILEPISLYVGLSNLPIHLQTAYRFSLSRALGSLFPLYDLNGFITGQTPNIAAPDVLHRSSLALAWQLGNVYSLVCLVGIGVCWSTTEPKVLRNYLFALAVADVGHVYCTYLAMGWDAFVDVGAWNSLTWGNVGITGFLLINRIAYLLGVFGYAKAPKALGKKE